MEINIRHEEACVFALNGRLDTMTSQDLLKAFGEEEIKESLVIVDMKELEYISSAGLRALLTMKKELAEKQKVLEVHHLNDVCTKFLE